MYLKSIKCLV